MTLKGLAGGLAAVGLAVASMTWLSHSLARLPWSRLVSQPELPPPVEPVRVDAGLERGLLPNRRAEAGSVPLYMERRAPPVAYAPPAGASAPAPPAPTAAPRKAAAMPARSSPVWKAASRLQSLPSMVPDFDAGDDGAAAPAPGGAPQGATGAFQPAQQPAAQQGPEPEAPQQYAPEGYEAPAQKARRAMRAVPQGNASAINRAAPSEAEAEEDQ